MVFLLESEIIKFPKASLADEDGLLAIGGDLRIDRLLEAYSVGIFPWYSENSPILWYAPPERFVLYPDDINVSKSMKKIMRSMQFTITFNQVFDQVIESCAEIQRNDQDGTWIVDEMKSAYISLHQDGYANSIEVWENGNLVGGLYGILVGKIFCGESMFSKVSNASKAALIFLAQNFDLELIDCQVYSDHLSLFGAKLISRTDFSRILETQDYVQYGFQKLFRNT